MKKIVVILIALFMLTGCSINNDRGDMMVSEQIVGEEKSINHQDNNEIEVAVNQDNIILDKKVEVDSSSVIDSLNDRFKLINNNDNVEFQQDSFLWWIDDKDYSVLIPASRFLVVSKPRRAFSAMSEMLSIPQEYFFDELKITRESFIDSGFVVNEKNSSKDYHDATHFDYIQAFEKAEQLCIIKINSEYSSYGCGKNSGLHMCYTMMVGCSNDLVSSQKIQYPFLKALNLRNKQAVITILNQEGLFYQVGMHGRRAGSTAVIKKEGDEYRVLFIGQEGPPCEILDKENIPNAILSSIGQGRCWTGTGEYRDAREE